MRDDKHFGSSGDGRLQLKRYLVRLLRCFNLPSSLRLRATAAASHGYRRRTIKSQSNYASSMAHRRR